MDPPQETPSTQTLNSTFGVLFIGFILAVTLYGLTFFQTHVFLARFHMEHPWTKSMVTALWLIDTATTALISHIQYYYLIEKFSSPFVELELTKTFVAEKGLSTIAIFIVQTFWAIRVRAFAGAWHPSTLLIGFLTTVSFAFNSASTVQLAGRSYIADLITPKLEVLIAISEGLVCLCDISIVISNFAFLGWKPKANSGVGQHWFDRVVLVWVNRGTAVATYQLALFLTFVTMPHGQVWILFHFVISKCYINSLLSMLNTRRAHGGRGVYEDENSLEHLQPPKVVPHPPSIGHMRRPQRRDDLSVLSISVNGTEFTNHSIHLPASIEEETILGRAVEREKSVSRETTPSPTSPMSPLKFSV